MAKIIIGVMGPGHSATAAEGAIAERLGQLIAENGWVTLTGGMPLGVMHAALRGAKRAGGLTIAILPGDDLAAASDAADLPIATGLGEARNIINVLSSHVLFVCGNSAGTASEVAFALKTGRPTVLVGAPPEVIAFWRSFGSLALHVATDADDAINVARALLSERVDTGHGPR